MADPIDPNAPANPPGMPQQGGILGGLSNLLNNPLVQGAAAAYFGAAQMPKHESLAGRIGGGGLAGLQQYNTARQNQLLGPLLYGRLAQQTATTNLANARIPQAAATANLANARTAALAGNPQANKDAATMMQMQMQAPGTSPAQKQILAMLIPSVASGITKPEKVAELVQKGDVNAAQVERDNAQRDLAKANQGLIPARAGEIAAQAGAANARASEASSTIGKNIAETNKANRPDEPKPPGAYSAGGHEMVYDPAKGTYVDKGAAAGVMPKAPTTPTSLQLEEQAERETQNAWKSHWHLAPWGETYEDFSAKFKPDWLAKHASATGGGAAAPPDVTHEIHGPDGKLAGHRKADGTIDWVPGMEPHA